jgi:hypothetical protein
MNSDVRELSIPRAERVIKMSEAGEAGEEPENSTMAMNI